MKRGIAVALLLMLCLLLTACGDSPEKLAQEHPEMIGTWGSILKSEEPCFTLRADGTCTYDRQDGKWKFNGKESNDTWLDLTLTLDGGKKVNVGLWENSYSNVGTQWTASLPDATDDIPIVNRELYQRPQKIVDAICGTWYAAGEDEPTLTLSADGTCEVDGRTGAWCETMEAWDSPRDDLYQILVQTDDGEFLTFLLTVKPKVVGGDEVTKLYCQNQAQIDALPGRLPSGTYDQFADRAVRREDVEFVEITPENLFDYFERADSGWWEKDAFGDYVCYQRQTVLRLKDEYLPRLCAGHSNIAVEAKMQLGYYKLEGTLGSGDEALVRDESRALEDYVRQGEMGVDRMGGTDDAWFGSYIVGFSMDREDFDGGEARGTYAETFEITRAAGQLCLTKE